MDADGPYCIWPRVSRYVHIVYPMAGAWVQDKEGVRQLAREELRPLNEVMKRHLEQSMEGDFTTDALHYTVEELTQIAERRAYAIGASLAQTRKEFMEHHAPSILNRAFESGNTWHLPDGFRGVRHYRSPEVLAGAPAHEFRPDASICMHCGATEEAIEDGVVPRFCRQNR